MADEGIRGLTRLIGRIHKLSTDARNPTHPLKAAGVYLVSSVERNFQAGGRPKKWQALAASTIAGRRKGRKGRGRGSKILIDTGAMKAAVDSRVHGDSVEVGLTKVQAARQHFGYPGGKPGRGHAKTPARPFLMIQKEDLPEIQNIFKRHFNL